MDNRSSLSRMDWAVAAHTNGFASSFYRWVNSSIVFTKCLMLRNESRLIARWVIRPNQRPTWLSQEA